MKTVFVHPERCIGCKQCEIACAVEHSQSKELSLAIWEDPRPVPRIHVEASPYLTTFPNKCRHCSPAPCVEICPTGALYRDTETDTVRLHPEKCIACGMCAMVCPFDVIVFDQARYDDSFKIMNLKCDHCPDRTEHGLDPACVETCKVHALEWGDINEILKKGRKGFTEKVSMVVKTGEHELTALPENMQIWRNWQHDLYEVNSK